jgi:hypothetical protein
VTKDEALKLALEALENCYAYLHEDEDIPVAITAIKQALAVPTSAEYAMGYAEGFNDGCKPAPVQKGAIGAEYQKSPWDEKGISMTPPEAPVKDNSNYRLDPPGLDPVGGTQVSKVWWDGDKLIAKPIPFVEFYKAAPDLQAELDATNRQVEILSDALAESRREVARLKAVQEPVAWRYTDARGHYRYRGYVPGFDVEYRLLKPKALCLCTPPAQPAPVEPLEYWNAVEGWVKIDEVREHFDSVGCGTIYKTAGDGRVPLTAAQRQWVGLTDEEKRNICRVGPVYAPDGVVTRRPLEYRKELEGVALMAVRKAEAKLKEKNT